MLPEPPTRPDIPTPQADPSQTAGDSGPGRRSSNLIAWLVIVVSLAGLLYISGVFEEAAPTHKRVAYAVVTPQIQMMMRMANGFAHPDLEPFAGSALLGTGKQLEELAHNAGPGAQLACAAILARTGQTHAASEQLAKLETEVQAGHIEADDNFKQLMMDVRAALNAIPETDDSGAAAVPAVPAPPLSNEARARLTKELGESGRTLVALAADDKVELRSLADSAEGAVLALGAAVCIGMFLAFAGVIALGTFLLLACLKMVKGPGPSAGVRAPLYAELFAVWIASYLVIARLPHLLLSNVPAGGTPVELSPDVQLLMNMAAVALSVTAAILWMRWRGVRWAQLRQDVALTPPRVSDFLWGLVTYSMALTLLIGGVITYKILEMIVKPGEGTGPSHPVLEWVQEGGALTVVLTFLLASVCAPLTEEFLFRGAIYRNLRDTFGIAGPIVAAIGAMLISSLIFAGIHPQGLLFIPVLMSLAIAFCIMREWRGSINPGMWAHAINNTVMITLIAILTR